MKKRKLLIKEDIPKLFNKIWKKGNDIKVPSGKIFIADKYILQFIRMYKVDSKNDIMVCCLCIVPGKIRLNITLINFESYNDLDITLQTLLKEIEKAISKDLKGLENILRDVVLVIKPDIQVNCAGGQYKFSHYHIKNTIEKNIRVIGWKLRNDKSYRARLSKLIKRYEKEKDI